MTNVPSCCKCYLLTIYFYQLPRFSAWFMAPPLAYFHIWRTTYPIVPCCLQALIPVLTLPAVQKTVSKLCYSTYSQVIKYKEINVWVSQSTFSNVKVISTNRSRLWLQIKSWNEYRSSIFTISSVYKPPLKVLEYIQASFLYTTAQHSYML